MTDKHTPGPWSFQLVGNSYDITASAPPHAKYTGAYVASCRDMLGYADCSAATHAANARLIAAAPDLLRELQCFVDRWGKYPKPPTGDDLQIYLESARSAIAKATA